MGTKAISKFILILLFIDLQLSLFQNDNRFLLVDAVHTKGFSSHKYVRPLQTQGKKTAKSPQKSGGSTPGQKQKWSKDIPNSANSFAEYRHKREQARRQNTLDAMKMEAERAAWSDILQGRRSEPEGSEEVTEDDETEEFEYYDQGGEPADVESEREEESPKENHRKGRKVDETAGIPYNVIAGVISLLWIVNIIFISWLFCGRDTSVKGAHNGSGDGFVKQGPDPRQTNLYEYDCGINSPADANEKIPAAPQLDGNASAKVPTSGSRSLIFGTTDQCRQRLPKSSEWVNTTKTLRAHPVGARPSQSSRLFPKTNFTSRSQLTKSIRQPPPPYLKPTSYASELKLRTITEETDRDLFSITSHRDSSSLHPSSIARKPYSLIGKPPLIYSQLNPPVNTLNQNGIKSTIENMKLDVSQNKSDVKEPLLDRVPNHKYFPNVATKDEPMEGKTGMGCFNGLLSRISPEELRDHQDKEKSERDNPKERKGQQSPPHAVSCNWKVYDVNKFSEIPPSVLDAMTCAQDEKCTHDHSQYRLVGDKIYVSFASSQGAKPSMPKKTTDKPMECCMLGDEGIKHKPIIENKECVSTKQTSQIKTNKEMREIATQISNLNLGQDKKGPRNEKASNGDSKSAQQKTSRETRCLTSTQELTMSGTDYQTTISSRAVGHDRSDKRSNISPSRQSPGGQDMPPPPSGYHVRHDFSTSETTATEVLLVKQGRDEEKKKRNEETVPDHRKAHSESRHRDHGSLEVSSHDRRHNKLPHGGTESRSTNKSVHSKKHIVGTKNVKKEIEKKSRSKKLMIIGKLNCVEADSKTSETNGDGSVASHKKLEHNENYHVKHNSNLEGDDSRSKPDIALAWRPKKHGGEDSGDRKDKKTLKEYIPRAIKATKDSQYFPMSRDAVLYYYKPMSKSKSAKPSLYNHPYSSRRRRRHDKSKSGLFSLNDQNQNASISIALTPCCRSRKIIHKSNIRASIERGLPSFALNTNSNAGGTTDGSCEIENNVSFTKSPQDHSHSADIKETICKWIKTSGSESSVSFNDVEYVTKDSVPSDVLEQSHPFFCNDADPNSSSIGDENNKSFEDSVGNKADEACTQEVNSTDQTDMAVPEHRRWTKTAETFFFKFETIARKNTTKTVYSTLPTQGHTVDLMSVSDNSQPDQQNLELSNNFDKVLNAKSTISPPAIRHSRIVKRGHGTFSVEEISKSTEDGFEKSKATEPRVAKLREQPIKNRPQTNPRLSRSHSPFVKKHQVKKTSSDRSAVSATKHCHKKTNDTPSLDEANKGRLENDQKLNGGVFTLKKLETDTSLGFEGLNDIKENKSLPCVHINAIMNEDDEAKIILESVQFEQVQDMQLTEIDATYLSKKQEVSEQFCEVTNAQKGEDCVITMKEGLTTSIIDENEKIEDEKEQAEGEEINEEKKYPEQQKEPEEEEVQTKVNEEREAILVSEVVTSEDRQHVPIMDTGVPTIAIEVREENEEEEKNYDEEGHVVGLVRSNEHLVSSKDISVVFEKEKDTDSVLGDTGIERDDLSKLKTEPLTRSKLGKKPLIACNNSIKTKEESDDPKSKPPLDKKALLLNYRKKMKRLKICKAPQKSEEEQISEYNRPKEDSPSRREQVDGRDEDGRAVDFTRTDDELSSLDGEGISLKKDKQKCGENIGRAVAKTGRSVTEPISEDAEGKSVEMDTENGIKSPRFQIHIRKQRKGKKRKKPYRSNETVDRASSVPRLRERSASPESNHSRSSSIPLSPKPDHDPKGDLGPDVPIKEQFVLEVTSKYRSPNLPKRKAKARHSSEESEAKSHTGVESETPTGRRKKIIKIVSPQATKKENDDIDTDTSELPQALIEHVQGSPPPRAVKKKVGPERAWNNSPITAELKIKPKMKRKIKYRLLKAAQPKVEDIHEVFDVEKPDLTPWHEESGGEYNAGDDQGCCGGLDGRSDISTLHHVEFEKKHTDGRVVQFSDSVETYITSPREVEIYDESLKFVQMSPRRVEEDIENGDEDCMETPSGQVTCPEYFCSDADESAAESVETPLKKYVDQTSLVAAAPPTADEAPVPPVFDKPAKKKIPVWIKDKHKVMSSPKQDLKNKGSFISGKNKLQARSSLPLLKKKKTSSKDENSVSYNTKLSRTFQPNPLDDKAKITISTIGSPVDIKEIIEGSSVDKSLKKGKKATAVHETKSAPIVSTKKAAMPTSKTSVSSVGKLQLNKVASCKKTVAQCSPGVVMGKCSSPRLHQLSPPDSASVRSTDLDTAAHPPTKTPRQSVQTTRTSAPPPKRSVSPKNVPHWNRPTPQWIRPVRRDRKLLKKPKAPGGAANADQSGKVPKAVDHSNTTDTDHSETGSLSGNLSRMVHGMFSKLTSLNSRRHSQNPPDQFCDTQAEPVASMII